MLGNNPVFHDHTRHWIAIVGVGAGGARVFEDFITQIELNSFLRAEVGFILFESRPYQEWGRGVAWGSNQSDLFLANMRFDKLGLPPRVEEMIKEELGVVGEWDHSKLPEDIQFVSRKIIGEYFHENLNHLCAKAEKMHVPVIKRVARVTDVARFGRYLSLRDNEIEHAVDYVVLALGNVPKRLYPEFEGHPQFYKNPWQWEKYENEVTGKTVGVVGLGPTAVDTILLCSRNGASRIHAASRNGQMQYPRPKNENHVLQVMSPAMLTSLIEQRKVAGKEFDYSALEILLNIEFEKAGACDGFQTAKKNSKRDPLTMLRLGAIDAVDTQVWFSVMKALDDVTPLLWFNLSPSAKAEYKRELQNLHANLSYGMALNQADRLVSLLQSKRLSIGTLRRDAGVTIEDDKFAMHYNNKEVVVDILVNCTGIGSDPDDLRSLFVRRLTESGLAHPLIEHGGFVVDFVTGQTLEPDTKRPTANVYSLAGSFTRGTHLLTNCLGQLFASCKRTSHHILKRISDRPY